MGYAQEVCGRVSCKGLNSQSKGGAKTKNQIIWAKFTTTFPSLGASWTAGKGLEECVGVVNTAHFIPELSASKSHSIQHSAPLQM